MRSPILIGYATMLREHAHRIVRIWAQTLLPPVVTTTLYYVIFGAFIGSQISGIAGFSYMQYIVPGLVMMTIITSSYMHTVSAFFLAKFQRNVEELLVSPMPSWVVVGGYVSGGVLRGLLVGVLVLAVSLFFTHLALYNVFIIFAAAILTSVLFALAGLVNGMFAKSFDAMSIIPTFVLTPLTYLGGVFYSIEQLPPFWQQVSLLNPILYMVNAFRYGFLGVSDVPLGMSFLVMGGFILALLGATLWFFKVGKGLKN
ncbi:MAG TPA: ABC transporter permease [Candidatus Paceibacterota bacterium]|nr:ABC transporter permease [Candidatus Paceibacterota bacterium]